MEEVKCGLHKVFLVFGREGQASSGQHPTDSGFCVAR